MRKKPYKSYSKKILQQDPFEKNGVINCRKLTNLTKIEDVIGKPVIQGVC